jgi:hypothetical protein
MLLRATVLMAMLAACAPIDAVQQGPALFVFRLEAPAFIELNEELRVKRRIPIALPDGCGYANVYPAPRGPFVAIELNCAHGPAVLWLNTYTSDVEQPFASSDSHFLAWTPSGEAIYARVDSINWPRIVRLNTQGGTDEIPITAMTYDMAPGPGDHDFLFSYSHGIGLGSEMWSSRFESEVMEQVASEGNAYLSLARWSPDGRQVAFIKIPDSATPFTVGELWVMLADGTEARKLADVDSGHGFWPAWSPDGTQIAFVARENPGDRRADTSARALLSNVYIVNVADDVLTPITDFQEARVESPAWHPDGAAIAFAAVVDDRMTVFVKNLTDGGIQQVPMDGICCVGWLYR